MSIPPVPCLAPDFASLRFMVSSLDQVQVGKSQLEVLVQSIAQLLQTINAEYSAERLLHPSTSMSLADLARLVNDISVFVQKEASFPFLKLMFTVDRRNIRIEGYYRRLHTLLDSFQLSAVLNFSLWQMCIKLVQKPSSCHSNAAWKIVRMANESNNSSLTSGSTSVQVLGIG